MTMTIAVSVDHAAQAKDKPIIGEPGRGRCQYFWNGRAYFGLKAVAAAAGVSRNTVLYHLRENGNLDSLGVWNASRYEWRGKIYRRQSEVAAAAGVCRAAVSSHLVRHGNLDALGVGVGRNPSRAPVRGRSVRFGARVWPSIRACALELGVSRGTIRRWVAVKAVERAQARLMLVDAHKAMAGAA